MHKYFLLPLLILMAGCSSEELPEVQQAMEIQIDEETVTFTEKELSGNENCGQIFVNASAQTENSSRFRIDINITTSGRIKDIHFVDYSDNNRHYRTADFTSAEVFFIDNYSFSPLHRTLNFDFNGTLYEINRAQNTKLITGKVNIDHLENISCSFEPSEIEADINQEPFNVVSIVGTSTSTETEWLAVSDDGIKISIITADNLQDMPAGVYSFTKDDLLNRVTIEKYTGSHKATDSKIIRSEEWESFQYEGELIIEEQAGDPTTRARGSFNLKAYKDNEVVYEITNGKFSI